MRKQNQTQTPKYREQTGGFWKGSGGGLGGKVKGFTWSHFQL